MKINQDTSVYLWQNLSWGPLQGFGRKGLLQYCEIADNELESVGNTKCLQFLKIIQLFQVIQGLPSSQGE